jgi:hypothetical protein
MRYGLLIFVFLIFNACNSTDIRQILAGTDTIEIIFYQNQNQAIADTIRVPDKTYIREIIDSFGLIDKPHYKCGYQGKLRFLKSRVNHTILEAEFNLQKDCAYLTFIHHKTLHTRTINAQGVEFLELSRKYKEVLNELELANKY